MVRFPTQTPPPPPNSTPNWFGFCGVNGISQLLAGCPHNGYCCGWLLSMAAGAAEIQGANLNMEVQCRPKL